MLVTVGLAAFRLFFHRTHVLTEKDTVVLADFANSTGDPVFDGTLRQGMGAQLEQSPFLSLISEERIQQVLRMMGQPTDAATYSPIRSGNLRADRECRLCGGLDCEPRRSVRIRATREEVQHGRHPR